MYLKILCTSRLWLKLSCKSRCTGIGITKNFQFRSHIRPRHRKDYTSAPWLCSFRRNGLRGKIVCLERENERIRLCKIDNLAFKFRYANFMQRRWLWIAQTYEKRQKTRRQRRTLCISDRHWSLLCRKNNLWWIRTCSQWFALVLLKRALNL